MTAPARTLKPCGTSAARTRHRKRGEPVCDPCRAAWLADSAVWRNTARAAAREARQIKMARAANLSIEVAARMLERSPTRTIQIGQVGVVLGAFAGTDIQHPFVPDASTGTSCMACFGWCNDFRHWPTGGEGGNRG